MPDRPHIILFNPDQWRGDVLGHLGNPAAVTPNLDRLVETEAVSFRNASCQNPVCTPSRCSFMTGWYPHVRGHRSMQYMLRADEPVMLKTLKEQGYFVWWGGKNDLVPAQHGVDHVCDVKNEPAGPFTPSTKQFDRGEPGGDLYYSFYRGRVDFGDVKEIRGKDAANVEDAIAFIKQYDGDKPLCIYLALSWPHCPYGVFDPWFSLIDRSKLPPRRPLPPPESGKSSLIRALAERFNLTGWPEARFDELRAVYYGMCAYMDDLFGRFMTGLREAGIYDDSAVFFFSDHGDFTGDYCLPNKAHSILDDNLTQVPLIVKPPKNRPAEARGRVTDAIAELIDLPATVFDLAGITPDWDHFGRSLMPVVTGETETHRDAAFCEGGTRPGQSVVDMDHVRQRGRESEYWPVQSALLEALPGTGRVTMCRTDSYKYIHRLDESDELYDLKADPLESTNRIDDPALAAVRKRLERRTMDWYLETGDVTPRDRDRRK